MSGNFTFQISKKHLVLHSLLLLSGICTASLFLRFSKEELLAGFKEQITTYFAFSGIPHIVILLGQEFFWILLMIAFARIPYGKIASLLVLFYKGFSIGVIASVFCREYGAAGIKYIFCLLLPQSILYILSLCLAAQISFELSYNLQSRGQHSKIIPTDARAYIISFVLTALGVFCETIAIPWLHQTLF